MRNETRQPAVLADGDETPLDFRGMWNALRAKAWLVIGLGVIGLGTAYGYLRMIPHLYFAQAVLQIDVQELRVVNLPGAMSSDFASLDILDTIAATFRSRSFLREVVTFYKLLDDPDFLPPTADGKPHAVEDGVNALLYMEQVQPRRGTRFIDVGAQHKDARVAQKVANALANDLIRQTIKQRKDVSKIQVDFLSKEAEKLKEKLHISELARQDYAEKHSISLQEKQDTVIAKLKNQSNQLIDAKAARMRLEADDEEIRKLGNQPAALLNVGSVANHPVIVGIRQQIQSLESKIVTLSLRYTDKHPKMIQAKSQLADARASLLDNVSKIPPLIHAAYEAAVATEEKFAIAARDQEKLTMELNKQSIEYNVLCGEVDTNRALYESILKQHKETEVAKGIELSNIHLFEAAQPPGGPMMPKKSSVLAVGLLLGLGLGAGATIGLNAMDSSLKGVAHAEQVTSLRVAAAVPDCENRDLAHAGMVLHHEPDSPVAEAFRSLRTFLHLAGRKKEWKTVVFTSAVPGEGKTFCSINYAVASAQQGCRTVLIDADLRAPKIGSVVLRNPSAPGLTEYLEGGEAKLHATDVENLLVMPAGKIARNPAELLASPAFGKLVAKLQTQFDCMVIDTAPVLVVSDTFLLVEHAQSMCLVARANKTPRESVLRASQLLTEAGAKPTGLVLNRASTRTGEPYGPYTGKYGVPGVYASAPKDSKRAANGESHDAPTAASK